MRGEVRRVAWHVVLAGVLLCIGEGRACEGGRPTRYLRSHSAAHGSQLAVGIRARPWPCAPPTAPQSPQHAAPPHLAAGRGAGWPMVRPTSSPPRWHRRWYGVVRETAGRARPAPS